MFFVFCFFFSRFFFIDCRRVVCCVLVHDSRFKKKKHKNKRSKIRNTKYGECLAVSLGPISSLFFFFELSTVFLVFLFRRSLLVPFNVFVNIIATTPITDCLRDFNRFVVKCEIWASKSLGSFWRISVSIYVSICGTSRAPVFPSTAAQPINTHKNI